jgi:hypothetical protein
MTFNQIAKPLALSFLAFLTCPSILCLGDPANKPQERLDEQSLLEVSIDFASGSGRVLALDQRDRMIRVNPTPHPGRGWACWWYFKVKGIRQGETLTVDVGEAPWATPDRAAFSLDQREWRQTEPGVRHGKRIVYRQQVDATEAWFAWGPPFTPTDAEDLVRWAATQSPAAEAFHLCVTRAGRPVPALKVSASKNRKEKTRGIWVLARQHAWESGSSWVCRGFVEWLVSDDPRAKSLREKSLVYVVPVMDVDSVAIGAGGKNRDPYDHNRDWSDEPHWRSVAAAVKEIESMDTAGRFDLFVDLHNPGADSKNPFYYASPRNRLSESGRRNLDQLLLQSQQSITGLLTFRGPIKEAGPGYDQRWEYIGINWIPRNCRPHVVGVCLETPWNTPHSTADGYRSVGRQLGMTIEGYFKPDK